MILICTCAWTIIAKTTKTLSTPQKRSELDVSAKMNGNEKAACQQLTKNLINIVFAKCQLMNLSLPANGKTNPAKIVRKEKSVLLLRQRLTAGAGGKWGKKFGKEALINRCVIGSGGAPDGAQSLPISWSRRGRPSAGTETNIPQPLGNKAKS